MTNKQREETGRRQTFSKQCIGTACKNHDFFSLYFFLFLLNLLIGYVVYQYCGLFDRQRVRNTRHNPTVKRINSSLEHGPVFSSYCVIVNQSYNRLAMVVIIIGIKQLYYAEHKLIGPCCA